MNLIPLSNIDCILESGYRPQGGIIEGKGEVPSIGAEHLDDKGGFNFSKLKKIPRKFYDSMVKGVVKPNDILIVKDGATTGKVSFVDNGFPYKEAAINEHVFLLRYCDEKVFPKYVFWHLFSPVGKKQILKDFRGATVGGISKGFLDKVEISLPSPKEQKRVAAILDKADAIRRKRQQAIKLAADFLRATFLDMFGDPITNPKGWPVFPLEKVGKISTGTTPSSDKAGMFGGNIPFITPGDLENGNEEIKRFVTEEGSRNSRTVRKGSTLVCCIGATIGKIGIAQERSAFNQQINAIEWHDAVNDLYGLTAMGFLKDLVIDRAIKTTLPILKKSEFEKINIPVPPQAIQTKYDKIFQYNSTMKAKKKSLNNFSNILFNSLTQRAFRGEL